MTGRSARQFNSSERVALRSALLVAEAAWVAPVADAALLHVGSHVSFLALALVAIAVLVTTVACSRAPVPRPARIALGAVAAGLVVTLAAGLIGTGDTHAGVATLAWTPWRVQGGNRVAGTIAAWSLAFLAGARGLFLGVRRAAFPHDVASTATGVVAFVLLFVVLTTDHERALHRATGSMLLEVAVFLACSMTVLIAVRRSDIERDARPRAATAPRGDMTAAGTVLAVTAASVLLAVGFAAAAPEVGRALAAAAHGVDAAAAWIWDQIPWRHHRVPRSSPPRGGSRLSGLKVSFLKVLVFGLIAAICLVAVAVFVGLRLRVARLRRGIVRERHPRPDRRVADDEDERDSLFSRRHLLTQLLAWLRRRFSRRGRTIASAAIAHPYPTADDPTVRGQYRRLLAVAAHHGVVRHEGETASEFEQRLGTRLSDRAAARADLDDTTRAYELVRYAARDDTDLAAPVRDRVDRVVEILDAASTAGPGPAPDPPVRSGGSSP